ncbi:sigma-70 family RNA polymerase sigma factor [Diaminobutyricibacter sp. McL0608]|uniref:sigma-70 family RNA polymerase sigma factor n=1 Tax=Leifsonia sp. McL0608 TaxID=3143537 RepID=UPI0031F2E5E4
MDAVRANPQPPWRPSPEAEAETAEWRRTLTAGGAVQRDATERLYELLLRVSRGEVQRRAAAIRVTGPELDDLAHQAAGDAVIAVIRRLHEFRGESRFTTWACKFAMFEVSTKVGRHFWQHPTVPLEGADWERLPDRLGITPEEASQDSELLAAVRAGVESQLTRRQRQVFLGVVVDGIPIDALALRMKSTRGALYKTLFDARRKLRGYLVTNGYLDAEGKETR